MAIYSDQQLMDILEGGTKKAAEKRYADKVKQNAEDVKSAIKKAGDNAKGHIITNNKALDSIKDKFDHPNGKKKDKKKTILKFDKNDNLVDESFDDDYSDSEYLEEKSSMVINGKRYRLATKKEIEDGYEDMKSSIEINGKKYIYDYQASKEYDKKHPVEAIGRKTGSTVGTAAGAAIGGATGAVAGAALGTAAGGIAGGVIGHSKGGRAVSNTIRKADKSVKKIGSNISKGMKKALKKEDFDYRNVYRTKEFTMAMEQYFDITDDETRKVLLAVNEEDQNKVLVSLTSKLYDSVIDKVDDIDFGEIPMTKGDITKLSNYNTLIECVATIRSLLIEFKQSTEPVDTISEAIDNIKASINIWRRAFTGNIELPMVVYNTIVLSIIEATSYLVATCVEFIKTPSQDTFQIVIDKNALGKSKQHMLFDNLKKFNSAYKKGQITNAMEYVIKENVKNFGGLTGIGVGTAIVGIVGLLFCIVPIIRELIFLFYYNRVRMSEFFDLQSDLLQMSAYNVENNRLDLDKEQRKSISSKQLKISDRFRKWANAIAVKTNESEKAATKQMKNENKKYKVDEVMDELPDSASSALF